MIIFICSGLWLRSVFIRKSRAGILPNCQNFHPHSPMAFSKISPISIRIWQREYRELSGVLEMLNARCEMRNFKLKAEPGGPIQVRSYLRQMMNLKSIPLQCLYSSLMLMIWIFFPDSISDGKAWSSRNGWLLEMRSNQVVVSCLRHSNKRNLFKGELEGTVEF